MSFLHCCAPPTSCMCRRSSSGPPLQRRVTRAEVALVLAAEAVLEHEGAVRPHAPLLAHLALLAGDACQRPADALTGTLLSHLLAALSLPHLHLQRASGACAGPPVNPLSPARLNCETADNLC